MMSKHLIIIFNITDNDYFILWPEVFDLLYASDLLLASIYMSVCNPKKRKTDLPPRPKHGVHLKYEPGSTHTPDKPNDPEDPFTEKEPDPDQLPWENEGERELRPEWEDPDAPTSL